MEERVPIPPVAEQSLVTPPKKNKKIIILVIIFAFTAVFSGAFYFSKNEANKHFVAKPTSDNSEKRIIPTLTPIPFYEMTIPYLRDRIFEGSLGEVEEVSRNSTYTSYLTSYTSDGFKINGLLTVPIGKRPESGWPAIIFIHGYIPPSNYQMLVNYSAYVDRLASNGFVVFKIDLRGHGDSEGEASGAYYSSDYIIDVLNSRAALKSLNIDKPLTPALSGGEGENFVDSNKIGLWGHSMGGNIVLRSLAARPEIPAVVIWAGAVYTYDDWKKYGIQDGSYRPPAQTSQRQRKRDELFSTHGEFLGDSVFWKMVPATNYLSGIKGAVQLNHAIDDSIVNVGYSRDLGKLLAVSKIRYELNEYSTGGHNITGPSFNRAMEDTVNFFRKNL